MAGLWWWSSFRLSGWPSQGGGEQASCGHLSLQDEEQAHYLLPAEAECRRRSSGCQVPCSTARPGLGALQTTERYYGASLITSTKEKCTGTISMKGLLFIFPDAEHVLRHPDRVITINEQQFPIQLKRFEDMEVRGGQIRIALQCFFTHSFCTGLHYTKNLLSDPRWCPRWESWDV